MTPDPESRPVAPELGAEQEVDFGRYWRAVLARWWLPVLAAVVGAIIGLLVTVGGTRRYEGKAQVYLGQPLAPGAGSPVSSAPIQLALVTHLLEGEGSIRTAAAKAGLKPSRLRGNVSIRPIVGITGAKVGTPAPLLEIAVTGSSARKVAAAANALAAMAVEASSTYQDEKIRQLKERFAFVNRELDKVGANIDRLQQQVDLLLASRTLGTAERLFALTSLNSALNFNQQRETSLEQERFTLRQLLKLAEEIERGRIVEPAIAVKTAGPSRRADIVVGAVIGFLLGVMAALVWEPLVTRVRARQA